MTIRFRCWGAMTLNIEDLKGFLQDLSGSDAGTLLTIRDPGADLGWRAWTDEDSLALCDWALARLEEAAGPPSLECFTQKEAAAALGVSVPKMMDWVRRPENPLPHIQDGRMIYIPAFLLEEWLREESERCVGVH